MIFIAEIGLNHNGNFGLVFDMMRAAKNAGADIVKFQLGWRAGEGEMNQIDKSMLEHMIQCADHLDVQLMFSIFTKEAFDLISQFEFDAYKVASRTVKDDLQLVKDIVAWGKPTYVSLGMWDGEGVPIEGADNIQYLFCISKYPTHPWELKGMPKDFSQSPYVGYSDHAHGIDSVLLAITRGAKVIEKHFTLDKSDTTIRDHALSATPEEFRLMTELGRALEKKIALGA